jgi:hypothetical protein
VDVLDVGGVEGGVGVALDQLNHSITQRRFHVGVGNGTAHELRELQDEVVCGGQRQGIHCLCQLMSMCEQGAT